MRGSRGALWRGAGSQGLYSGGSTRRLRALWHERECRQKRQFDDREPTVCTFWHCLAGKASNSSSDGEERAIFRCCCSPRARIPKLWAIHPFGEGTRAATGMAPPRTVPQEWLSLSAISPTHYAPNWAGATLQLPRAATTLGCQKLRDFSPYGVSPYKRCRVQVNDVRR